MFERDIVDAYFWGNSRRYKSEVKEMDNVRMPVTEVERITGLQRSTLYKLMDLGAADLGAIIPGERKTYVFFRPKVERFVQGGCDIGQYTELVSAVKMMNFLLTNAILSLPEGLEIIRNVEEKTQGLIGCR